MIKRKKKDDYKFSDKSHPIQGIIGFCLGIVVLVSLCILFYISSKSDGNAGLWISLVGIALLFIDIVGFIFSVKGFSRKDIYYRLPISGIMLNGGLFIIFLLLYIVGL